ERGLGAAPRLGLATSLVGRWRPMALWPKPRQPWRGHGPGRRRPWSAASVWRCAWGHGARRWRRSAHRRPSGRGIANPSALRAGWRTIWTSTPSDFSHVRSKASHRETTEKIPTGPVQRTCGHAKPRDLVKPELYRGLQYWVHCMVYDKID